MTWIVVLLMGLTTLWNFVACAAMIAHLYTLISGRLERVSRVLVRAHKELWIVFPPGALASLVEIWHSSHPYLVAFNAWGVITWWSLRNWPDDDNEWKRRAKKAKETVAERAGRLVIVPVGSES